MTEKHAQQTIERAVLVGLKSPTLTREENASDASLEELKALAGEGRLTQVLRPVESLFGEYPLVRVSPAQAQRFQNGGSLDLERLRKAPEEGLCRVKSPEGQFLGLGRVDRQKGQLVFAKSFFEREDGT